MRAKPASQRRSREKRDRILTALDSLLERKPFGEITVAELARCANVPPATLYQRFSNEDATASVLLELYYRLVQDWAARPRSRKPPATLLAALRSIARDAYEQVEALGHVMRPAYLYSRQRPDRVGQEWQRLQSVAVDGFRALLEHWRPELGVVDLDAAGRFLAYYFNVMAIGPLLHADDAGWDGTRRRERFVRDTANMAYRYQAAGR